MKRSTPTLTLTPPAVGELGQWAAETAAEIKDTLDELLGKMGTAPVPVRAAVSVELEKTAAAVAKLSGRLDKRATS